MFSINSSDDALAAASQLALAVAQDLRTALTRQPRALLLVSGGRSPVAFFSALRVQQLEWERVDISLVDERSVGADDADSNERLVRSNLLCDAAAPARWIELMPQQCIDQNVNGWDRAQHAVRLANAKPELMQPAVIVLGLGNDGHTASLFPDAAEWSEALTMQDRYMALQPRHAPHARISLSLQALKMQRRCYMWACGNDKTETLNRLTHIVEQASQNPQASESKQKLEQTGPAACLMADPNMMLEVYCCA